MTKIENFKCRNSQYRLHPCISIRGYAQKFLRTHRWPLGLVVLALEIVFVLALVIVFVLALIIVLVLALVIILALTFHFCRFAD